MINDYYSLTQLGVLKFIRDRNGASAADIIRECPVPAEFADNAETAKTTAISGLILSGNLVGPDTAGKYQLTPDAETMFNQIDMIRAADRVFPLGVIAPIAEKLLADLRPLATRLEIAGSIRRKKPTCGDIELCAIASNSDLRTALKGFASVVIKSGDKYTQVILETAAGPVKVDLFETAREEQWGLLYFIRTGSADFIRRALAYWKEKSGGGYCRENCLYRGNGELVQTFDETTIFAALHCQFIAPERRIPHAGG